MKFISYALSTIVLLTLTIPVFAQKYKTPADTGKLNAEYVKVQNNIADLTAKLTEAQSALPAYKTKAVNAGNDAQTAAAISDTSSSKATSGNLQDSKDAKTTPVMLMTKPKIPGQLIIMWVGKMKESGSLRTRLTNSASV